MNLLGVRSSIFSVAFRRETSSHSDFLIQLVKIYCLWGFSFSCGKFQFFFWWKLETWQMLAENWKVKIVFRCLVFQCKTNIFCRRQILLTHKKIHFAENPTSVHFGGKFSTSPSQSNLYNTMMWRVPRQLFDLVKNLSSRWAKKPSIADFSIIAVLFFSFSLILLRFLRGLFGMCLWDLVCSEQNLFVSSNSP